MFNVIVNKEYELLFERLKAEAPDSFALSLADFSHPDEKLNVLLEKADAIIGQVNLSDSIQNCCKSADNSNHECRLRPDRPGKSKTS